MLRAKNNIVINPIMLIITLCLLFSTYHLPTHKAYALSIEDEKIMGQKFFTQIRNHFHLIDNDFANQYMFDIGQYLIRPMEPKYFPFNFHLIKDNSLNAFAGPGGHIFFFSGLIAGMDEVDELAAVMCHEIGHISARHLAKRIEQNKKIGMATLAGVLAAIFVGGEAGSGLAIGSIAAGIQSQLYYSRKDERQADQLGFKYMKAGGFDPKGMIITLNKIEQGSWFGTEKIPAYLLTHPTGPERMANLDSMLSDFKPDPPKKKAERFRVLFPFFKTVVIAKSMDFRDAERLFNRDLKKSPDSSLPYFGLGVIQAEKSEYEPAIRYLKKALELDPDFVPILTSLGDIYQMNGQDREAISILEKALKIDENDKSALFFLGLSYENLEQYNKTIRLFERLASFNYVKNDVYYHLGISYGRQNRLALAHFNFGLYFKNLGQIRKAKFHFRKSEELSGNNPSLKKKIYRAKQGLL